MSKIQHVNIVYLKKKKREIYCAFIRIAIPKASLLQIIPDCGLCESVLVCLCNTENKLFLTVFFPNCAG
jgi:hypothetical protein